MSGNIGIRCDPEHNRDLAPAADGGFIFVVAGGNLSRNGQG